MTWEKEPGGLTWQETIALRAKLTMALAEVQKLKLELAKHTIKESMADCPFKVHEIVKIIGTPSVGTVTEVHSHEEVSVVFGNGNSARIYTDKLERASPRELDLPVRPPFTMNIKGLNLEVDWEDRKVKVWEEG